MSDELEHAPQPYMIVWGVLFALTVAEVFFAFTGLPKFWIAVGLILMAVWKAGLVAMYYMHLRSEPARLRLMVLAPLPLAVILVITVMQEF